MSIFPFSDVEQAAKAVGVDLGVDEFSKLADELNLNTEQLKAVKKVFEHLRNKKVQNTIDMYLRTSRLPLKVPKTFDSFDFSVIKGRHADRLQALPSLTAIHAHKNLAFIGPPGTGKTHFAQAYGYECCQNMMKTYFCRHRVKSDARPLFMGKQTTEKRNSDRRQIFFKQQHSALQ